MEPALETPTGSQEYFPGKVEAGGGFKKNDTITDIFRLRNRE
jgi:hypothetical protein